MSDPFTRAFTGGNWGGQRPRAPTIADYTGAGKMSAGPSQGQQALQLYREPQILSQEEKEEEAGKKLRLFEALAALRDGKLPTNEQILNIISRIQKSRTLERKKASLSDDGQQFMNDFDKLMDSVKQVIDTKNEDENLQQFIFHSRLVAKASQPTDASKILSTSTPSSMPGDTIADAASIAFQKGTSFVRMLIINNDFRDLLWELSDLLQDSLSGFEDTLDQGSEDWDQTMQPTKSEETLPTGRYQYYVPEDPMTMREESYGQSFGKSRGETIGTRGETIGTRETFGTRQDTGESFEEKFTPQRRKDLAIRLQKVMLSIQDKSEFQDAVEYLVQVMETLGTKTVQGKLQEGAKSKRKDANLRAASHDLKHLLEKFAGNVKFDPLIDQVKDFAMNVEEDFYLRDYLTDLKTYLGRSVRDRRFVESRDYCRKGEDFINRGRALLIENYRDETNDLMKELSKITKSLKEDEVTRNLATNFKSLMQDLLYDDEGNMSVKTDLIQDLATVILPMLVAQVKVVPIPRIEHNDPDYHVIVENIILTSENFLPNVMEVKLKTAAVIGLRKDLDSTYSSSFTLNFYQMYADVADVPFYFKRKRGFPKMSDHGVANVFLGGQGMSIILKLGFDKDSTTRTLYIRKIKCYIDDLRIEIRESRHDGLYRAIAPLLNNLVRRQITNSVEGTLKDWVGWLDNQITPLKNKSGSSQGVLGGWLSSVAPNKVPKSETLEENSGWKTSRFDRLTA